MFFRSPVPALLASALIAAAPWRGCGVASAVLAWYGGRLLWLWWRKVVVTIDGVPYKEPASTTQVRLGGTGGAARRAAERTPTSFKDGFATPRENTEEAGFGEEDGSSAAKPRVVEWAPFSPSLPLGDASLLAASPAALPLGSSPAGSHPYWLECDAEVFDVRNVRYSRTKEKIPSEFALYDCVGMDMIRDRRRIDAVVERLPPASSEEGGGSASRPPLPASPPGAPEWSPSWGVPRVFVVNCQLPYKAGWIMGSHPEDDGGLSVLSYFVLSARASELLSKGQYTPALQLLRRFVEEGVSTKEGISFKVVGRVEDLERYEVPESFHRFNNKPVLLTKSSRVVSSRLPEVLEIDYDVRSWVYPARTALANYHHRAREAELEIGYLVEGKTDEELPEQILGCFKLINMDITQAKWVSLS